MFKFKNIHLDDETMWPEDIRIKLEKAFEDERGYIQPLVNFPMKNLSMIFSHKGKLRANHNHNTDWHYTHYIYSYLFGNYKGPSKYGQQLWIILTHFCCSLNLCGNGLFCVEKLLPAFYYSYLSCAHFNRLFHLCHNIHSGNPASQY